MSAASKSIPLTLAHEQQGFRLLELPNELVTLLESPDPPILHLKSANPSLQQEKSGTNGPFAVLCSPSKTFQLRQLQTSNSIYLTQSHATTDKDGTPTTGIVAISRCTSTMEIQPSSDTALERLRTLIPVWTPVIEEDDQLAEEYRQQFPDRERVFSNVPCSEAECIRAWKYLGAFQSPNGVFQASLADRLKLWTAVVEACLIEQFDLGSMFKVKDLWNHVEETGLPPAMLNGLLYQLAPIGEEFMDGWAVVDQNLAVRWVGCALLETIAKEQSVDKQKFLEQWKEKLPEKWAKSASVDLFEGISTSPTPSTILFKDPTSAAAAGTAEGKSTKRKWHQKFAAMRKR